MSNTEAWLIVKPRIPARLKPLPQAALTPAATLTMFTIGQADISNPIARGVDISEGTFEHVILDGAKLTKLLANDIVFKHCGLANTDCSEGSLIRVEFTDGRMTGWDANASTMEDVLFRSCKLDMANFRSAKLKRVRFEDCILSEADFLGAELEYVAFQDCLLEKVQFGQCKMKNVDLRTSQLIDISGWQSLKGATIDSVQLTAAAPYLANELGIKIED